VLKWVIEEKVNNNIDYPGLELEKHDKVKLLHHATNNPNNNCTTLKALLEYLMNGNREAVIESFLDILNRSLLRKSENTVETLLAFYEENKFDEEIEFNEVILEASIYMSNEKIFKAIIDKYKGDLPQI